MTIRFKELNYEVGNTLPFHVHDEGQVLFARSGTMEVTAENKLIIVPSSRLVWVPPKIKHSIKFRSNTQMRTAFIDPKLLDETFKDISVFQATGLFRETLLRLVEDNLFDHEHRELLEFSLIKEMNLLKEEPFLLKIPRDKRAKLVAQALLKDPSNTAKINEWADQAACSAKTLSRLFKNETGLAFRLWRRHLRLLHSHQLITEGCSITTAAHEVGFATSSALAEAHKQAFGYSPTKLLNKNNL